MKRISNATRSECIRLRREEQHSTPVIARKVGLSNCSVYNILRPYPWRGFAVKKNTWSKEDISKLHKLWPTAEEAELLAAFPKRNIASIGRKASALSIRRRQPGARNNKRFIHPIIKMLRDERERQRLTRPQLAKKAGYHWMQLHYWEMGKQKPLFDKLIDWAEALGLKVIITPVKPVNDIITQPAPEATVKVKPIKNRTRLSHFTPNEIRYITQCFRAEKPVKEVATALGCDTRSIYTRYAKLRNEIFG
jgi:transcriptional regulator with XRE-family HTH domain